MSMDTSAAGLKTELHTRQNRFVRAVSLCLVISALAAVIGLVFLGIFFSGVSIFGPLNDIMVVVQYVLMIPVLILVHRMLPANERLKRIGFLGAGAVIVLQSLLVLGIIPFQIQVLLVIPSFFVVAYWFAAIEKLGRADPRLPKGKWKAIFAGLVIGYPWWALDFRRRIHGSAAIESTGKDHAR